MYTTLKQEYKSPLIPEQTFAGQDIINYEMDLITRQCTRGVDDAMLKAMQKRISGISRDNIEEYIDRIEIAVEQNKQYPQRILVDGVPVFEILEPKIEVSDLFAPLKISYIQEFREL